MACASDAFALGVSPLSHACAVFTDDSTLDASQVFSGLLSHFLAECPSRPLPTHSAVCMPFYSYNLYASDQATIKAGLAYWGLSQ